MSNRVLSTLDFAASGAGIVGLSASTANGQPVVHEQIAAGLGGMTYQSAWNAATNTPVIPAAAVGNKGHLYVVSVAGSTSVSGITDWQIGDWLVSNGASWDKIDNTEPDATEIGRGNIEIATQAETDAGTDDLRAITPLKIATSPFRAKRFAADVGNGVLTSIPVTHNLGTRDISVSVRDATTHTGCLVEWVATSTTVATLIFATAPATNAYRVVVLA